MPKLNNLQSILLATAAQRDSGSLYPLTDSATAAGARLTKALFALIKAEFAEERETEAAADVSRTHDDLRFGLYVTAAGRAAIGISNDGMVEAGEESPSSEQIAPAAAALPARVTKAATVVELLQRPQGATLAELIAATSWLPHTTRASLTGLRKKGHVVAGRSAWPRPHAHGPIRC